MLTVNNKNIYRNPFKKTLRPRCVPTYTSVRQSGPFAEDGPVRRSRSSTKDEQSERISKITIVKPYRTMILFFSIFLVTIINVYSQDEMPCDSLDSVNDIDSTDSSASEIEPAPLWMEAYSDGTYETDLTPDASLFVNIGKRIQWPVLVDVYGKCKVNKGDQRYYWNNRTDLGLGLRGILESKVTISAFAEYLTGYYMQTEQVQGRINKMYSRLDSIDNVIGLLNNISIKSKLGIKQNSDSLFAIVDSSLFRTRDSLRNELTSLEASPNGIVTEWKGGFTFWKGWGQDTTAISPLHFWGNIYGELVGSILKKKIGSDLDGTRKDTLLMNAVLYVNPEIGISTKQSVIGSLVLSLDMHFWLDVMGDAENNRIIAGPDLHYFPFKKVSLDINAGCFAGTYFNRNQESLPKNGVFTLFYAGFSFWYGLGMD